MKDKQEVEVVDFLLQVKDCIVSHLLYLPCLATRSLVIWKAMIYQHGNNYNYSIIIIIIIILGLVQVYILIQC